MSTRKYKELERSPDGRYLRFDRKMGVGAYKSVWLAYDTEKGIEVAWNTVDLQKLPLKEKNRLRGETDILKALYHPNIIEFYHVWSNAENEEIIFTTELLSSGTLKEYTTRTKDRIKLKVIKKWCRQILLGLNYLHTRNPPVIHRDLKCDNIFINGSTGNIRIGDLGLSTQKGSAHLVSVLGTPEFMAPELYEEFYTEKVDIYAFGMCLIEMCTNEYPYQECANPAQIYRKVSKAIKPAVLARIIDEQARGFISICLDREDLRLSAAELLQHPFLAFKACALRDNFPVHFESSYEDEEDEKDVSESKMEESPISDSIPTVTSHPVISVENYDLTKADLALKLQYGDRRRVVKFQFDFNHDTAESIASEMVAELRLPHSERALIASSVETTLDQLAVSETSQPSPPSSPKPDLPAEQKHAHVESELNHGKSPETDLHQFDPLLQPEESNAVASGGPSSAVIKDDSAAVGSPPKQALNGDHALGSDNLPSDLLTSDALASDHLGSDALGSDHMGSDHMESDHLGSDHAEDELVIMTLKENLKKLTVKELKRKLEEFGSDTSHCIEKSDLVDACIRLEKLKTQKHHRQLSRDSAQSDNSRKEQIRVSQPQRSTNHYEQPANGDQPANRDGLPPALFGIPPGSRNGVGGDESISPKTGNQISSQAPEQNGRSDEASNHVRQEAGVDVQFLTHEDKKKLAALRSRHSRTLKEEKQKLKKMYEETKRYQAKQLRQLQSKLIHEAKQKHKSSASLQLSNGDDSSFSSSSERKHEAPVSPTLDSLNHGPPPQQPIILPYSENQEDSEQLPPSQHLSHQLSEKSKPRQRRENLDARDVDTTSSSPVIAPASNSKLSMAEMQLASQNLYELSKHAAVSSHHQNSNGNGKGKERKLRSEKVARRKEVAAEASIAEAKLMSMIQIDIAPTSSKDAVPDLAHPAGQGLDRRRPPDSNCSGRSYGKRGSRDPTNSPPRNNGV